MVVGRVVRYRRTISDSVPYWDECRSLARVAETVNLGLDDFNPIPS